MGFIGRESMAVMLCMFGWLQALCCLLKWCTFSFFCSCQLRVAGACKGQLRLDHSTIAVTTVLTARDTLKVVAAQLCSHAGAAVHIMESACLSFVTTVLFFF